jgi:hypothetical protein
MLNEKSPIPRLKLPLGVTKPSDELMVTVFIPNGVEADVLIATVVPAEPPERIGRELLLKEHEAPLGKPLHASDENVPEYPPSLVRPKTRFKFSPGSIDTTELLVSGKGFEGCHRAALTPVTRFGLGLVP